jgi:hypothetical protein
VETPEPPREANAVRLGRAAEARGLAAAGWAGRGDEVRGLAVLALVLAAAYFVALFLPWIGRTEPFSESGWILAHDSGDVALAVILVETLRLRGTWVTRGSELLAFCLTAAAGILGVESVVNLRWGNPLPSGFRAFQYGAWLGFAIALLLVAVAALRLAALWRPAP